MPDAPDIARMERKLVRLREQYLAVLRALTAARWGKPITQDAFAWGSASTSTTGGATGKIRSASTPKHAAIRRASS